MNIYDISKKAGVSIATVSRVINSNANVSPSTREKVLQVIKDSDYIPNTFARGLGLNTMHTIGIMCADSSDPFMAKAIYYLEQDLRKNHYDVLLCCTGYALSDKQKYLDLLLSKRTDAIILVGSNFIEIDTDNNEYIRAAAKKVPIMILNGALKGTNIYSTLTDDYNSIYEATNLLISKGFKDILYLYNSLSYSGNRKRLGFIDAIKKVEEDDLKIQEHLHYIHGTINEAKHYLESLYDNSITFDAIIASDDELAIGALKFAKSKGIHVPNQLSIIGYNNSLISTCTEPELTTIDNKLESLCTTCISTLMGVFNNQSVPIETIYPAEIIVRGSTLC